MKFATTILPLAAFSAAFVIPDDLTAQQLAFDDRASSFLDGAKVKLAAAVEYTESVLDSAINAATAVGKKAEESIESWESMVRFDTKEWLQSGFAIPGEHGPPGHPGHPGPGRPRHPHHGPPNQTVYEIIASSNYTTKLAKLIQESPDLVKALNGTSANFTVFAPIDSAFDKIPKHKKPSKKIIEEILTYHVSPSFYPAGRLLASHTIPSAYNASSLGGYPQRLRVGLSLRGPAVNFYSHVIAINIFGTNGVIHALDTVLLLPPESLVIVDHLPGEFSTLELGLLKTGLGEELEKTKRKGGTFFAPSNAAFQKLSPRLSGFLFSKQGLKYLKKLLEYHIVPGQTLYSDAFYRGDLAKEISPTEHFHYDLPTLLKDKNLSVDIGTWGAFTTIKINAFTSVAVADGVAADGVIQVINDILIPPRSQEGDEKEDVNSLTVEELKERLMGPTYAQEL